MLDNPTRLTGPPAAPDPGPALPVSERARTTVPVFLAALRQRRWTLIATIILVPLSAFVMLHRVTPLYTARGSLIYEPAIFTLREMQSILRTDPTTEAMMASQAELLQSLKIAQRVADRGNLFANPEFNAALRPSGSLHTAVCCHARVAWHGNGRAAGTGASMVRRSTWRGNAHWSPCTPPCARSRSAAPTSSR